MTRKTLSQALIVGLIVNATSVHAAGAGVIVREALELACKKSGRELTETVAREAAEQSVEASMAKFGPKAAATIADGGLELVEATAKYGDDVMRAAVEAGPAARRMLALDPARLVPLVRTWGAEALEIEIKAPGMASRVFVNFGADGARKMARTIPAEDVPRLVSYAERADAPATRQLLLKAYEEEGARIFTRIPPRLVWATGLSAAAIYGIHRLTAPFADTADLPGGGLALVQDAVRISAISVWSLIAAVVGLLLWRWGLMPWHRSQSSRAVASVTNARTGSFDGSGVAHRRQNVRTEICRKEPTDASLVVADRHRPS